MAGKTGRAVVGITTDSVVLVIGICLVVRMTINTTELRIIGGIGMAVGTGLPFAVVFT